MINQKGPYRFILDTGSSGNVIDEDLAMELGLEVIGEDPLRTRDRIINSCLKE